MRLSKPRILPLSDSDLSEEQRLAAEPLTRGRSLQNIFRTLIRYPIAFSRFVYWGNYVLSRRNSLPPRQREIVILRVGFLCKSGYEFAQHVVFARNEGVTDDEISAVKFGALSENWSSADSLLIEATDELVNNFFVNDRTWAALQEHFTEKQCLDAIYTVGQYVQVSMLLNTLGVQLDEGLILDPDLKGV
jgi:4-carboxymuconolactone decarboxylase